MPRFQFRWRALIATNVLVWGTFGLYTTTRAAPQLPFANSVQQRAEMIRELKEIKLLLKEQNTLLRSALMDQITDDRKRPRDRG